jgi:thioesterase domain-containing protein
MVVCNFYLGIGRRVPASLRMFYFFEISRQAMQEYVPQIYSGRIVLLKGEKSSLEWSKLAAKGLEILDVPGRHLDLLRGPHAQVLGEKLRSCLDQAHTLESGKRAQVARTNYLPNLMEETQ